MNDLARKISPHAPILAAVLALSFMMGNPAQAGALEVTVSRILNFKIGEAGRDFGRLTFVGGLRLASTDRNFGGISGIRILPGRDVLVAATDSGYWIRAAIERDVVGAMISLDGAEIEPIPGATGNFLTRDRNSDCEAVELDGDTAFLAYERAHRIERYSVEDGRLRNGPVAVVRQDALGLKHNHGVEAIALMPASGPYPGALVALSEASLDENGNHRAFVISDGGTFEFALQRSGAFGITDADFLPNGDLLILERAHTMASGHTIRLRQIAGRLIFPGTVIAGELVIEADKSYRIDNFEGLDVSVDADGAIFITLVSDDNHSSLQETLLLEFRLQL
jgi:hypothetical protein